MNKRLWAIVLCLMTAAAFAQPPQRGVGPGDLGGPGGQAGNQGGVPGQLGPPTGPMFMPPVNPMFAVIDANGDGVINAQELRRAVVALRKLDTDRDGNITLAEASPQFTPSDPKQMIDQTFAQYDKNGDGLLAADELPEPMARMMGWWDQNGDGAVSREELAASMPNMGNVAGGPGQRGGFDQQQMSQRMVGQMMQYDRNGDGHLTPNEVPPQMMGMLQGADRNGDGAIDPQELQAMAGAMGQRMGRGMGAGGEPQRGTGRGNDRGPRRGDRGDQ